MLFSFALVLFFVQSFANWLPFDEELTEFLTQDFAAIKKIENGKEFPRLFVSNDYARIEYYEYVYAVIASQVYNVSVFAESWVIGNGNYTRTQAVEFINGNETGIPLEVLIYGSTSGYVIERGATGVTCTTAQFNSVSNLKFGYVGTRFITPMEDEFDVVWGPRLIDLYYSTYDAHTYFVVGIDSFNYELVLFYYHQSKPNSDVQEIIYVHEISYETFNIDNVEVPAHVTCLDDDRKEYSPVVNNHFPHALF